MNIVGRQKEISLLKRMLSSKQAEFLALYGRRRVGKTFLIQEFFQEQAAVFFKVTGTKDGSKTEQINNFTARMSKAFYGRDILKRAESWRDTFELITQLTYDLPENKKIVLFLDELPWMATPKSQLLQSLDYYWNEYWSNDPRIKLIVCGSSASWMVKKLIKNKGGLHNRLTETIHLKPFSLRETEQFLHSRGIKLNRQHILFLYMAIGGIPYYLTRIKKGQTAAQNIEQLAFSEGAFFVDEFDNLFASLFRNHQDHIKIVKALAKNRYGIIKSQLLKEVGLSTSKNGGGQKLDELEGAGFVMKFKPIYHKSRSTFYRLTDEYTYFYLTWIEPLHHTLQLQDMEPGHWQAMQLTPQWHSWCGYGFESICYKHLSRLRKALAIPPNAIAHSWQYTPSKGSTESGAQIDLLFDHQDDAIVICEIKYSNKPYVLTKDYVQKLQRKLTVFKQRTRSKKQIFITMVCANGLQNNLYADDLISATATLDDLFGNEEQ